MEAILRSLDCDSEGFNRFRVRFTYFEKAGILINLPMNRQNRTHTALVTLGSK